MYCRWTGLVVALGVVLSSCVDAKNDTLQPKGQNARDIHYLTKLSGLLAAIVGVLVAAVILFIVVKFRSRPGTEDELPKQVEGNLKAEIGWTLAPFVLLFGLAIVTVPTIFDLARHEDGAIEILVEGQQWWWQYSYDLDGDGVYEIVTANDIVFPAGQQINLDITSNDVIHSFWVPELNGKKDAVPGRVHQWKIQADEPGVYGGTCTEFCGLAHADMRIRAVALSAEDWDAWVAEQTQPASMPGQSFLPGSGAESIRDGYDLFGQHCSSCHVINGAFDAAGENPIPLASGVAPNLTHLMSRTSFAGAIYELYNDDGSINESQLRAWVRDAPGQKPLEPENQQGMISFADKLSDEDLEDLLSYLETLGSEPIRPNHHAGEADSEAQHDREAEDAH